MPERKSTAEKYAKRTSSPSSTCAYTPSSRARKSTLTDESTTFPVSVVIPLSETASYNPISPFLLTRLSTSRISVFV